MLFFSLILFHIGLLFIIEKRVENINSFSYKRAMENFRSGSLPQDVIPVFLDACGNDIHEFSRLAAVYFSLDKEAIDMEQLKKRVLAAEKYHPQEFKRMCGNIYAVWNDLKYFPAGPIANDNKATLSFEDSWMNSRTFGGDRGHEGCDIMASLNERGLYPIYSMTDGVIENIGWLRLGGYRIGIRSPSGAYFYYAHLSEYAKEFQIGDKVTAGMHIGFMGDTGYSDIPGTTGNFPVHLHLGIYLNDENNNEYSVNSYPVLKYLYDRSVWKRN